MPKTYRPYDPDQAFLLPVSLRDWLPGDHVAYFLSDVVDALDLSAIAGPYEPEERGHPPYHPRMLVKVLLYAYCVGVPSSRRIAQRLREDIAFRVLAANNTPDFRTIADFRKRHLTALAALFRPVLHLCQRAGLVQLGHVALDGSTIAANASKHKAMSYGRMREEAARLEQEVAELLRRAAEVDADEDRHDGADRTGDERPAELAFRETRRERIYAALAALDGEAREEAARTRAAGKEHPGVPPDTAQRNFTDPDSRIMPGPEGKTFLQAYNAQAAVDSFCQVIVAAEVTTEPNDKGQPLPLVEAIEANTGCLPRELSADAAYFAAGTLTARGVEPFLPPDKTRLHAPVPPAPWGRIPQSLSLPERMRRKLRTQRGRRRYALRMETVEPVFGQIKQGRGSRQFLLRGCEKVQGEWKLICTGHNLLKLFGVWQRGGLGTLVPVPLSSTRDLTQTGC